MRRETVENFALKFIALILAVITWFYISGEMKRTAAGLAGSPYTTAQQPTK